jgi:hypothetical protein
MNILIEVHLSFLILGKRKVTKIVSSTSNQQTTHVPVCACHDDHDAIAHYDAGGSAGCGGREND